MKADELAKRVLEGEDPKQFLRNASTYHVVFLKDTCRPWQYAEYDVDASDEASAYAAGRVRLVAEIGERRARQWKDNSAARYRQEAEDPKAVFKQVSGNRAAQKERQRHCKHGPWETVRSYGAMGHRARCTKCGFQTDFVARD